MKTTTGQGPFTPAIILESIVTGDRVMWVKSARRRAVHHQSEDRALRDAHNDARVVDALVKQKMRELGYELHK